MRSPLMACFAFFLPTVLASAQTPGAAPPSQPAPSAAAGATVSAADRKFIEEAAIGSAAAIQTSQLALQKSSNDAVRQFAQRIISDHTKADAQLKQLAALRGVAIPAANSKADAEAKQLQKLDGSSFDKRYAQIEFKDHSDMIKLFHQQDQSTHDRQIGGFAGDTVPTFEEDSDKAEQLVSMIGSAGKHPAGNKTAGK
jgi:putative membrane protein